MLDVAAPSSAPITIGQQVNYIASNDPFTTIHGVHVLTTIHAYAPDALYDLHRIVVNSGEMKPSNSLKAMANIRDSSVEIANISAGKHHENCQQQCRLCEAAKQVAESGTLIVAGAGNDVTNEGKSMYCPALSDHVVSVGVFEALCTCDPGQSNSGDLYDTTANIHPPGAYWVRKTPESMRREPTDQPFCARHACSPRHSCRQYRQERPSNYNITFQPREPDVFAPDHIVIEHDDGIAGLETGSSYATAIVSGALTSVLGTVAKNRVLPQPAEVIDAIGRIGRTVGDTRYRRFDSEALYYELIS